MDRLRTTITATFIIRSPTAPFRISGNRSLLAVPLQSAHYLVYTFPFPLNHRAFLWVWAQLNGVFTGEVRSYLPLIPGTNETPIVKDTDWEWLTLSDRLDCFPIFASLGRIDTEAFRYYVRRFFSSTGNHPAYRWSPDRDHQFHTTYRMTPEQAQRDEYDRADPTNTPERFLQLANRQMLRTFIDNIPYYAMPPPDNAAPYGPPSSHTSLAGWKQGNIVDYVALRIASRVPPSMARQLGRRVPIDEVNDSDRGLLLLTAGDGPTPRAWHLFNHTSRVRGAHSSTINTHLSLAGAVIREAAATADKLHLFSVEVPLPARVELLNIDPEYNDHIDIYNIDGQWFYNQSLLNITEALSEVAVYTELLPTNEMFTVPLDAHHLPAPYGVIDGSDGKYRVHNRLICGYYPALASRSPFLASIGEVKGEIITLSPPGSYEAFEYVWDYLNGLHPKPVQCRIEVWPVINYFNIPLDCEFVNTTIHLITDADRENQAIIDIYRSIPARVRRNLQYFAPVPANVYGVSQGMDLDDWSRNGQIFTYPYSEMKRVQTLSSGDSLYIPELGFFVDTYRCGIREIRVGVVDVKYDDRTFEAALFTYTVDGGYRVLPMPWMTRIIQAMGRDVADITGDGVIILRR